MATCNEPVKAPFCQAVRGDRSEGWLEQGRSEVMAQHGMVVTSQPLAAQAGLQILKQGGNAVDAAVATAAALNLMEPMMVGVGGDLFAVIYIAKEHRLHVLNASGTAPSGATLEHFNDLGYRADPQSWGPGSGMPVHGILTVTVPGAVWGWEEVLKRFGTLTFKEVLQPAVDYAEHGFPVSERISHDWQLPPALPLRNCCSETDPDSIKTWMIDGQAPRPGQIFKNPELARTLKLLQAQGSQAFYRGEIARAIVAKSNALGGTMTVADLAGYRGEWVEPAVTSYHGVDVAELPPPSQAWAADEMLNILEACVPRWAPGQTLGSLGPRQPKYWHFLVEAKKLAYRDLYRYNADPHFAAVPVERLLSKAYAASLCAQVDPEHASGTGPRGPGDDRGDTIVLSTADKDGNMVSWVNSNFDHFGSGLTVPGYGFILHDRGYLFSLDPKSPNVIAPHKRPFNTLSAGFVTKHGEPVMTVTLMGGDMQAQGHAQILTDILDLGANLQAAAEMARFRHDQVSNELSLESPLFRLLGAQLAAMGHNVKSANGESMGGVQSIFYSADPDPAAGFYRSGSDHRKDGAAVGW
ncbi:MAG: gamma-glutamyltransferase family protein [Steroidobacteraceae bacterium]|jgi:gamma-glutamyltranspeptidase/glutathione hydrolase